MLKIKRVLCLPAVLGVLMSTSFAGTTEAEEIARNSPLCEGKQMHTMVAFSTAQFDVAICKPHGDSYVYIGQDRKTKSRIDLPVTWRNNPHDGGNPWVLKAKNGEYTYQVAHFNSLGEGNQSASLSVFKNGTRVYHQVSKTLLIGEPMM